MITTLLSTILATATLAAPSGDAPEKGKRGDRGEGMCQMLECTDAQKNEMKRIHAELRADLAALRAAHRDAMRAEHEEAKAQMRAVLDAKQQAKLEDALDKRGEHRGKDKKDKKGKKDKKDKPEKKLDKPGKAPGKSAAAHEHRGGRGRFASK
jgi:Spy/CpxP family protein refolding chaperone